MLVHRPTCRPNPVVTVIDLGAGEIERKCLDCGATERVTIVAPVGVEPTHSRL